MSSNLDQILAFFTAGQKAQAAVDEAIAPTASTKSTKSTYARDNKPCPSGKVKHETHADAMSAMKSLRSSGKRKKGYILEVFRCHLCQYWHVGGSSTKRNRAIRKARRQRAGAQ